MPIPFDVPAKYAADFVSGALVRSGALLKDASSGQIVAHLQETGLGQKLLSNAVNSPFSPISALATPSSLIANVQLAQLKGMMELLQMLQFASLGASIAGIGVSAIGFLLIKKKLNGLQAQIATFENRVEAWFKELHERELRTHYSRTEGLVEEATQAHAMSNWVAEFLRIAQELAKESAFFQGELVWVIQNDIFDIELFKALTQSYALCNAGRIECLLVGGELPAAHEVSKAIARHYNTLFDPLSPVYLARKSARLHENKDGPNDVLLRDELDSMRTLVMNLRDLQDAASSKPYLMETLIKRNIDSHEYMQRVISEEEHPILLLEAN